MILAFALAVLIGLALGLLGGGGSILTTPTLIYALGMEPRPAIATSLWVVGVTSLAALIQHARAGNVAWGLGLGFGAAGMVGAWLGGLAAAWFSETALMVLFGLMMLATSIAMLRGRSAGRSPRRPHAPWQIAVEGVAVGALTGLVGAGGGFLVVPALALLGGLSMPRAIGTSLLVITLKSAAGYAGHAAHVQVDLGLAAWVAGAAVLGSVAGSALASRIPPDRLRVGFAGFILIMSVFVLAQQL